jgi:hypothetical protein
MAMIGDTLRRVEIRFPLTFSAIATLVLFILIGLYWHDGASVKDTLMFAVIGAAAVGQITASFYTARVLGATLTREARDVAREAASDQRASSEREFILKKESLRFGERWNDPRMYPARDALRTIVGRRNQTSEQILVYIEQNETVVLHIMNFLEEMATCCRQGVVDTDLMKDQFDAVIVTAWDTLFPWIRKKRQEANPKIWEDSEALYDSWKRS